MSNITVFYSKKTDDWRTPMKMYDFYMNNGFYDPCPFQSTKDNLNEDWGDNKVFINPPYSKLKAWIEKAIEHHRKYGKDVTLLIPARTDTKAMKMLYEYGCDFMFIEGRLHFNDDKVGAPFPSMLVRLRGHNMSFIYYLTKIIMEKIYG